MKGTGSEFTQFEPGAPAPEGIVPLCIPEIRGNEWKYIKECLDTNWVSSVGPFVDRFEQMVADYVGAKFGVATTNGTAALHIALLVAGVQPDDEVLVSTLSFIAPSNAVRYVGAWPVFMDAEPQYWQLDPSKATDFIEKMCHWRNGAVYNKRTGRRVKAILPVHILGHPVDMTPILAIARKYELVVIEDAAESLGSKYNSCMVGHLGDIGCLSFNGNKIITTGGGGMIVTDNEVWAERAKYLTTQAKDDPVEYIHNEIGYNYRLTNIQAAMGVAQMEKLDEHLEAKRQIMQRYGKHLMNIEGIELPKEANSTFCTFWLYTVMVIQDCYGMSSRQLMQSLASKGIQTRPLWCPIHRLQPYRECETYRINQADQLYNQSLSLPSSVGLHAEDLTAVIGSIRGFASEAGLPALGSVT